MKKSTPHQLLKVSQMAALISVAPATIYRKIREDNLPHFKIGSDIRLNASEVLEHFKRAACEGR